MFPARYFPRRYFAARYWPKVGAEALAGSPQECFVFEARPAVFSFEARPAVFSFDDR